MTIALVHYHTPDLLIRAVAALETDLTACGLDAEILVVDNGSRETDRARLHQVPGRWLRPGRNLGYAGAINLAASSSRADVFVMMNPDVEVLPGCLRTLIGTVANGAAAAGPRFFWDRGRTLMLPPTEPHTRRSSLLRKVAGRGRGWARWGRRVWRSHARRHWRAERPLRTLALSGALMAVRRDAWERAGPFDDGFALYFEETDWLRRLPRLGLEARYVPAAEALHRYNQSASTQPMAGQWFAASAERFQRRHHGAWFAALERRVPHPAVSRLPTAPRLSADLPRVDLTEAQRLRHGPIWIEVSPSRLGYPAAAALVNGSSWRLPLDVWHHLTPGPYVVRAVDDRGRELEEWTFERAREDCAPEMTS